MENIIITKDFGTGKANAQAKAELTKIIMDALTQAFGEDGMDIKFGTFLLLFVFCGLFLWGSFFYFVQVSAAAARR